MSGYEKVGPTGLIEFPGPAAIHNPMFYGSFPQGPYDHHPLLQPGVNGNVQQTDFQYVPGSEYQSEKSFEYGKPTVESHEMKANMRSFSVPHQRVPSTHSAPPTSRKRKASSVDEFDILPTHKKAQVAQVHVQDPNGDYYDLSGHTSPYSPFVPTPTGSTGFPACAGQTASPRPSGHHYSTSTASQVSLAAPSPHTPAFSPSFTTVKSEQSPGAPMTPIPRPTSTSSPLKSSMPKLVRTSTMQQSPPGVCSNMVGQTQNFNPYAMYPLKANLKLKGDLDTMKDDWTTEERDARRRLVEFRRDQTNSTINAEFKPVTPQDRQPSSICISCIWWKEKNEYFVTSVDTIYLLEALVGVRFTVEEKNRIRRNLEGFRPMTVSKSKADSEEFFKVIMGFPHPKPRNIEKDVKVFPWKVLSTALKKIISKYSASYSSTAAAILTPASSTYSSNEGAEYHYPASPHPEYITNGNPYPVTTDMGYMPGPITMRIPASGPPAPVPELQLQMPEYAPAFDVHGQYTYQTMVHVPQGTMAIPPQPMTAPVNRMPAWEFANFVNDSPVTMAPQSAPPSAYPHGTIEQAEFIPAMHYPN